MKVEKRSWVYFIGGLLAFLGGFMLGGAQHKGKLRKEQIRRSTAR